MGKRKFADGGEGQKSSTLEITWDLYGVLEIVGNFIYGIYTFPP
jgi:hypothetical protein